MKRWKVKESSAGLAAILGDNLNILPLTAQLLINRGLADCGRASAFLSPELKDLHDPYLLKDMDRAVDRIVRALGNKEKIAVYGDYDVDGVTSSALLCLFFKELGCEPLSYIPQRQTEGYGLNATAIKKLASDGVSLIITVDCGSGSANETAFARSLGVDVVITDHHEMPDGAHVPSGVFASAALVNPKQEGCAFPFKGLAGIGVAFNLVVALRTRLRRGNFFSGVEPNLKKYLDLVCIGTIADMVPLIDENRIFVSHGLRELNVASRPGIRALIDVAGVKPGRIDADAVAFQFAPRINAAGRLSQASVAFELLTTTDPLAAERLARKLDSENKSRQKIEEEMLCEALAMIGQHATGDAREVARGLVLCSEKWHPGVIGIVASRLVERFGRPAVLIALENGIGRGSARSIRPFDMLEGLSACSSLLERFGGHKAAAGLTIKQDNVAGFRQAFISHLDTALDDDDLIPEITLDAVVSLGDMDMRFLDEVESLAPFGVANAKPLLCLPSIEILGTEVMKEKHLRLRLRQSGTDCKAIGFNLAGLHPMSGNGFNVAVSPYTDEWRGVKSLGLRVKDVKPSA